MLGMKVTTQEIRVRWSACSTVETIQLKIHRWWIVAEDCASRLCRRVSSGSARSNNSTSEVIASRQQETIANWWEECQESARTAEELVFPLSFLVSSSKATLGMGTGFVATGIACLWRGKDKLFVVPEYDMREGWRNYCRDIYEIRSEHPDRGKSLHGLAT